MGKALAAVIGHPIAHSRSPEIFSFLSDCLRFPVLYKRLDVAPRELAPLMELVRRQDFFFGWNVTVPHKEDVFRLCDRVSAEAAAVGAVNVVRFQKGRALGFNTDVEGIRATLREQGMRLRGGHALIYGAGGAARAVAYALGKEGASGVWILNRTSARGRALCRHFGALFPRTRYRWVARAEAVEASCRLMVNATPVGMKGVGGRFRFPRQWEKGALAFDLIYRPFFPCFLREARSRGLVTVNGLDMLAWQAIATWEIWFGKVANRERIKARLKRHLAKRAGR